MRFSLSLKLLHEFAIRRDRNPKFSLRSFARLLGISPTHLSRVMKGERGVSADLLQQISRRLGLPIIVTPDLAAPAEWNVSATISQQKIDDLHSDWASFAILELIALKGFIPSITWVSRHLGLSKKHVAAIAMRLQELGALRVGTDGSWHDAYGQADFVNRQATSTARKKVVCKRLALSRLAVDKIPFDHREHSYVTVAMNKADLPEARKILQRCRKSLVKLANKAASKDEVFHLDLSLFPVNKTLFKP